MKKRETAVYLLLVALVVALALLNVGSGGAKLTTPETWRTLVTVDFEGVEGAIVWKIRVPRIVAAATLGGALALSGYLLQTFFRNPIAGPYVLGISSGAKLAVALLLVASCRYGFALRSSMTVGAAFLGSALTTTIVILASRKVRHMATLILCGVMIGYVCSAATELVVSFADDSNIVNLHYWSLGSFASISWEDARVFLPIVVIGSIATFFLSKGIKAFLYGEEYARSVGVPLTSFRALLVIGSSLLSATVAAFAGPISFVGVAAPHVARRALKTSEPARIMPCAFLVGAAFCLLSDWLARRLLAPKELSVGTITAILGAPIVLSMILERKRGRHG